jgi:hypothetical protein
MPVTFDVGNGTTVSVGSNTQPMDTQRGMIAADEVVQGDFIRNISGDPRCEVVAPPVVS